MPLRFARSISFVVLLLLLSGCGTGDQKARVTGQVTFDGAKVEKGTIQFFDVENKLPSAAAEIKDGQYEAEVHPGKRRVEISAPKVVGQRKLYDDPNSPTMEETKESIPAKYNTKSELTREIQPGANKLDFDLKKG